MASVGVCFACVNIFSLTLFGDSGHVAKCFSVICRGVPQDGHARPTNSTVLCLPGKSMFVRSKMIAPSWPKVVRPVADGKDLATRLLSIGLFLATLFHD